MKKINEFMRTKNGCIFAFAIIYISIFIINCFTIWAADDYAFYNFCWLGQDKFDLVHIFKSAKIFYLSWTGRFLSTYVNYIFLYFPKMLFNIVNSAVYTGLIGIIYKMTKKDGYHNGYVVMGIYILTWLLVPSIGQVMFWQIGSVIYLWTFFLVSVLIYVYTNMIKGKVCENHKIIKCVGIAVLGVLAGNGFETNTIVVLCFEFLSIIYVKFIKKSKIPAWAIIGFLFTLLGGISNFISPGNAVRMSAMEQSEAFIDKIINGAGCWFYNGIIRSKIFILIIGLLIIYSIYSVSKKKYIEKNFMVVFISELLFCCSFIFVIGYVLSPSLGDFIGWFYVNYVEFWLLLGIIFVSFVIMCITVFIFRKSFFENTESNINWTALMYVISGLVGVAAYIMTPTAWPRSYMGMSLIIIMAMVLLVNRIDGFKKIKRITATIAVLIFLFGYGITFIDCYRATKWKNTTEDIIHRKIDEGEDTIYVNTYMSTCTKNAASIEKWVIPLEVDGSIPVDYEWINQAETNYYFCDKGAWSSGKRIIGSAEFVIQSKISKWWIIEYFK